MSMQKAQMYTTELPQDRFIIVLYITHWCNLNCKYCLQSHKDGAMMTVDTAKRVLSQQIAIAQSKGEIAYLRFMGGEPFANFPLIKDVSEWIWKVYPEGSVDISIRTNGTLLSDQMCAWLEKHRSKLSCGPSIDGIECVNVDNRGVHIRHIDFFKNNWPSFGAHGTLTPGSVAFLYDSVSYFKQQAYKFDIKIGLGTVWSDESASVLEQQMAKLIRYYTSHLEERPISVFLQDITKFGKSWNYKEFDCLKNHGGAVIDVTGKQFSCEVLMPLVLGEACSRTINVLDSLKRLPPVDAACTKCPFRAACNNCPAMNAKFTGSVRNSAVLRTTCKAFQVQFKMTARLVIAEFDEYINRGLNPSEFVLQNFNAAVAVSEYFERRET